MDNSPPAPAWFAKYAKAQKTQFIALEKRLSNTIKTQVKESLAPIEVKITNLEKKVDFIFLQITNSNKRLYDQLMVPNDAPDAVKGENAPRIADLLVSGTDWLPGNRGKCRWNKGKSRTLLTFFHQNLGTSDDDDDEGMPRAHILRSKCLDILGVPRSQQQMSRTILESQFHP